MQDIEIRQLGAEDVAAFKTIRLEALRQEPSAYASRADEWASLTDEEWRDRMRIPIFGAFSSAGIIGVMGLLPQQSSKMKHRATLIMVYLRASERGSGAARKLLEAAMAFAMQNGISQIELNVNSANARAIRFYVRSGFRQIGLISAGLIHEGQEIDELIMARRLK